MWCALQPWTKGETRAVMQPLNFAVLSTMAAMFALQGIYSGALLGPLVTAVLCSIGAAQLGILVFRHIGDVEFRWLLIALMLVSGAVLMTRSWT